MHKIWSSSNAWIFVSFFFFPPPFLSRVNNFQLCILWMCFHTSFFHNIERAHFQIPDVLFIYSEASGPRHGLVTATWQTCEKSEWEPVNKLYYTGKWWEQFKGERKRGAGGVEMKKEQISCLVTLCFLRLQMTSGTQIGNWGFCSFVNRALKTLKLNRSRLGWQWDVKHPLPSPCEELQAQAWCCRSYASSCILLKILE